MVAPTKRVQRTSQPEEATVDGGFAPHCPAQAQLSRSLTPRPMFTNIVTAIPESLSHLIQQQADTYDNKYALRA